MQNEKVKLWRRQMSNGRKRRHGGLKGTESTVRAKSRTEARSSIPSFIPYWNHMLHDVATITRALLIGKMDLRPQGLGTPARTTNSRTQKDPSRLQPDLTRFVECFLAPSNNGVSKIHRIHMLRFGVASSFIGPSRCPTSHLERHGEKHQI